MVFNINVVLDAYVSLKLILKFFLDVEIDRLRYIWLQIFMFQDF